MLPGMGSAYKLRAEVEMLQDNTAIATDLIEKTKECGLRSGSRYLVAEAERLTGESMAKTVRLGEKVPRCEAALFAYVYMHTYIHTYIHT